VIPERIISKPPSAEPARRPEGRGLAGALSRRRRHLKGLIERDLRAEELAAEGHDRATVSAVALLEGAE